MKLSRIITLLLCVLLYSCAKNTAENSSIPSFVKVENGKLMLDNQPYYFMGANYWYGMNLGMKDVGNRTRLIKELDQLQAMGVTNLRVLASSEGDSTQKFQVQPTMQTAPGNYNQEVLEGLDFFMNEMNKRNMKAVMVLNNFWTWSGGMPQYLVWTGKGEVPYPQVSNDWNKYTNYAKTFYSNQEAIEMFNKHLRFLIGRTNSVNGLKYTEDPTIMSWQLSNEPRGYNQVHAYRTWVKNTAQLIKSMDANHLVSIGSEGDSPGKDAGISLLEDNDIKEIDYVTIHIWAQNWGWYNPSTPDKTINSTKEKVTEYLTRHLKDAKKLGKPAVLEEFGIARDQDSYQPTAPTSWRDLYYGFVFNEIVELAKEGYAIQGVNFWAYSGEGRPSTPKGFWQKGDDLIGDPPHEPQGWYGIYATDKTTIEVINRYAKKIESIPFKAYSETVDTNE
ncbi:glycoside hydrolase 5 family protein [Flammeovirga kamogawensis]|uniref:mannan endo-1,4-beta-mannosidase n=1 Tax=Flammeovirga kamogawensis TaxID=373891 RepID=A0ABX8H421_9BACT|nr:hypothetical protein [Flammeovirga kamogawensis]MBB6461727.1 mannan endo-1,4-beta-mannosidase [Flammeovirga kamogawensis]QWG10645.1 hypothetical protein KM029_25005 [Flammeovirga kamogawensis]TRX63749.1 hypothetical protein EO216_25385 [Flammeovirga kamogawensis]